MFKKVFFFILNIIKCFFLCFLGVFFCFKGVLCLYEVFKFSISNETEKYYFTSIGMVEPDFVFLIGILFTGIGILVIRKAKYVSRHLCIDDKTE